MGGPVFDDRMLFGVQLRNGAIGPDLAELVVEGLVGHHQLQQLLAHRIGDDVEEAGEGAHGQAFDQHLHADDLLIDFRRADDLDQQIFQHGAAFERPAPAGLDIFGEGGDVPGFFAGLVGGVFLRALVLEHMAQRGRQIQRTLFAVQNGREVVQHDGVDEPRPLLGVGQVVRHIVGLQGRDHVFGNKRDILDVERFVEVDIFLVQRIPEVIVGGRNDLVEGGRAIAVAIEVQHGHEIVRRHRVVHGVLGDVVIGHSPALPTALARSQRQLANSLQATRLSVKKNDACVRIKKGS